MPLILLTNDDGIRAAGLVTLGKALEGLGEVWTIAPHVERSACGRSVTLNRPLHVEELAPRRLAVDGTPSDCVLLAVRSLLGRLPDLVISGINHGFNIGEDVDYSGTVAAAAEAALQSVPASLAVSVQADSDQAGLDRAAALARSLATKLLDQPLPAGTYLNVNLPSRATKRLRWTRLGNPLPPGDVELVRDPRGRRTYWIANRPDESDPPADTDRGALREGLISASLLTLDRLYREPWDRLDLRGTDIEVEVPN